MIIHFIHLINYFESIYTKENFETKSKIVDDKLFEDNQLDKSNK